MALEEEEEEKEEGERGGGGDKQQLFILSNKIHITLMTRSNQIRCGRYVLIHEIAKPWLGLRIFRKTYKLNE